MIDAKRIVVVMPAYNAEKTVPQTYREILATGIVDEAIPVDDASRDRTVEVAKGLPHLHVHVHERNVGYGGNQKSCYRLALSRGADIVIMVHPDYQYTPLLIPAMSNLIACGLYDCVLGSRILGGGALKGGMPLWRYVSNRILTLVTNTVTGAKLSEYHTGYRAFSADLLRSLPLERNSDDFVFDSQMLAQVILGGYRVGEVSCPTKYFKEASSINFRKSVKYGFGCLWVAGCLAAARMGLWRARFLCFDRRQAEAGRASAGRPGGPSQMASTGRRHDAV